LIAWHASVFEVAGRLSKGSFFLVDRILTSSLDESQMHRIAAGMVNSPRSQRSHEAWRMPGMMLNDALWTCGKRTKNYQEEAFWNEKMPHCGAFVP
jgi:hypothetical protein